jgi:hypothetical protein
MNRRLILAGLVICITQSAFAQESGTCMSPAQVERDRCTRESVGDDVAIGKCLERYLIEIERCSKAPPFSRDSADPARQQASGSEKTR